MKAQSRFRLPGPEHRGPPCRVGPLAFFQTSGDEKI
jgi:hypothetical protein